MEAADRLGNPELDFPIGYMYGDQDWLFSELGPENIVKNSMHFESGRSQIFTVTNATHTILQDQPEESFRIIAGFFDGTITHTWQPKGMGQFTIHPKGTTYITYKQEEPTN
jgi:pimeloyl-ACP methyl ester carboxylesterase